MIPANENFNRWLLDVMTFLVHAERSNEIFGCCTATEALQSFQKISGYDDEHFEALKRISLGDLDYE